MTTLAEKVAEFAELLRTGRTVEAIERFYDDDVCVLENRELVRSGKAACLQFEREQLAGQPTPPDVRILRTAANDEQGVAFLEYVIRFTSRSGRPMRLEEVAVQRWSAGKIVQERFYYDGFVDEGD